MRARTLWHTFPWVCLVARRAAALRRVLSRAGLLLPVRLVWQRGGACGPRALRARPWDGTRPSGRCAPA